MSQVANFSCQPRTHRGSRGLRRCSRWYSTILGSQNIQEVMDRPNEIRYIREQRRPRHPWWCQPTQMSARLENDDVSLDLHECTRIFQDLPGQLSSPSQPPLSGATELYAAITGIYTRTGLIMGRGCSDIGRSRNV